MPSVQALPCGCSHVFFKAHGMHSAMLSLAADAVANVRLHLCSLLPTLKRTLRLPTDAEALQRLHHAVVALQSDRYRDVGTAAGAAEGTMSQVHGRARLMMHWRARLVHCCGPHAAVRTLQRLAHPCHTLSDTLALHPLSSPPLARLRAPTPPPLARLRAPTPPPLTRHRAPTPPARAESVPCTASERDVRRCAISAPRVCAMSASRFWPPDSVPFRLVAAQFDVLTEGAALRRSLSTANQQWEVHDAARREEEEALVRAEADAVADAKRRAADELAERARAAYTTKYEQAGAMVRRSGDLDAPGRSTRASRELLSRHLPPSAVGGGAPTASSGYHSRTSVGASGERRPRRLSKESLPAVLDAHFGVGSSSSAPASPFPSHHLPSGRRNSKDSVDGSGGSGGCGSGRSSRVSRDVAESGAAAGFGSAVRGSRRSRDT